MYYGITKEEGWLIVPERSKEDFLEMTPEQLKVRVNLVVRVEEPSR